MALLLLVIEGIETYRKKGRRRERNGLDDRNAQHTNDTFFDVDLFFASERF